MRHLRRDQHANVPLWELIHCEWCVLELVVAGLTNRQIADRLFLTENTVKNYVLHVLAKLGLEHRAEAAALATKLQAVQES